jgi:uncharacterized protein YqgC (DUF456 family)
LEAAPILLWLLAAALVLIGIAGTVIPALPGTPFVFIGLMVAAWINDFQEVGWVVLTVLGVLTAVSALVDFIASSAGAQRVGAHPRAIVGAAIGTVVGLFFGIPGLIIGPFAGAVVGELSVGKGLQQAGKAGLGTVLGLALGAAAKLALTFAMIGIFFFAYLV